MADPDEYESLPESTPLGVVAVAGAVAGVAEHCAMYPVDSVKVSNATPDHYINLFKDSICEKT